MKELQNILDVTSRFAPSDRAILATVVDVAGSGYRRPGARMLIDENGYSIGTVSGGCLEADVLERAKNVLQFGEPSVVTYDTTQDENSVFGLSMGCRGVIRVLLERIDASDFFLAAISKVFQNRKPLCVATLINSAKENPKIGSRLYFDENGIFASDFDETLTNDLFPFIKETFDEKVTRILSFSFGEVFVETIKPPVNLLIFGAGYDALPLIRFAKEIGWRLTVIDHRPAFAEASRLPEADEVIVSASEDLTEDIFNDDNSVAVVMTHNYERDRNILRRLLRSKCVYIGALGPKKRTENLLSEIDENFNRKQLKNWYAPVGLDIGANTPETIALSIIAEIVGVLNSRNGGFLRERVGSIYGRD